MTLANAVHELHSRTDFTALPSARSHRAGKIPNQPLSLRAPFSTTVSIGGASFHPAPTGVRVVYAQGYAAFFMPAPDPQLSAIAPVGWRLKGWVRRGHSGANTYERAKAVFPSALLNHRLQVSALYLSVNDVRSREAREIENHCAGFGEPPFNSNKPGTE